MVTTLVVAMTEEEEEEGLKSTNESDYEVFGGEYYEAKASQKKEIKRQEREAHCAKDLVWCALKARVEARMIEWSPTSNTYYEPPLIVFSSAVGGAFVIFKTKDAAESAISELNKRCLILGEGSHQVT
ncbi:hypothetical protein CR513_04328, partial [Mucuna pruriens]